MTHTSECVRKGIFRDKCHVGGDGRRLSLNTVAPPISWGQDGTKSKGWASQPALITTWFFLCLVSSWASVSGLVTISMWTHKATLSFFLELPDLKRLSPSHWSLLFWGFQLLELRNHRTPCSQPFRDYPPSDHGSQSNKPPFMSSSVCVCTCI